MKVTKFFSQSQKAKETLGSTRPAMSDEPEDHAVRRGRDVSLHCEGGHSPEHHTVALENTDEPLRPDITEAEHVVVNCFPVDRGHLPRTINHEGRNAEE